ncbi:MAG: phosphotransferase, partial [Thermomicrobiales bacterium]
MRVNLRLGIALRMPLIGENAGMGPDGNGRVSAMGESGELVDTIRAAVGRLGWQGAPDAGSIRLRAGGMSGSAVYAFTLDGVPMVLKRTVPFRRNTSLMERAAREVRFYRELADRVPVRTPRMLGSDLDPESGALLLLAAYEATTSEVWARQDFAAVGRALGRFHAAMREVALPAWV